MNDPERADAADLHSAALTLFRIGQLLLGILGLVGVIAGVALMSNVVAGGLLIVFIVGLTTWLLYLGLAVATKISMVHANISVNAIDALSELKSMRMELRQLMQSQVIAQRDRHVIVKDAPTWSRPQSDPRSEAVPSFSNEDVGDTKVNLIRNDPQPS